MTKTREELERMLEDERCKMGRGQVFILGLCFGVLFMIILHTAIGKSPNDFYELQDQLSECQEQIDLKGDCIIYPWGVDFNVTKQECISFLERYNRYEYVRFYIGEYCEVIK